MAKLSFYPIFIFIKGQLYLNLLKKKKIKSKLASQKKLKIRYFY